MDRSSFHAVWQNQAVATARRCFVSDLFSLGLELNFQALSLLSLKRMQSIITRKIVIGIYDIN